MTRLAGGIGPPHAAIKETAMRFIRALTLFAASFAVGAGSLFGVGCDDADAAFDCASVCGRYSECFDADYDVGACRSRCRAASDNDATVRSRADACEACIDDMSCAGATFSCAQDCSAIVP
jgi:hypothetical protein